MHPDGATGVVFKAGDLVATLTTDKNGEAEVNNLYLGNYYVKEITPSEGYLLDEEEHDVVCDYEGDLVAEVSRSTTSAEQVIKQPFQLIKVSDNGDDTEAGLLAGAEFTAYLKSYIMQITRDNYSQYAQMVQQMFGKKASSNDPLAQCDYGNFSLRFKPVDINFTKPNWDTIMTKRDKPAMSEEEFDEAIKELARKEFATGKRDDDAYRKLCMQHGETVSPDRKAIYESSMKKTGGKMNAACMFWDSKGNKTLSYNPESRNWKAISTDEEFARARVFTSIYNDELARLKEEYGEKAKGNVSYSKIKVDISAERSKEKNNNEGNTIDLQI